MGWLKKIIRLARSVPDLSDSATEFTLLQTLVKGIKEQIKIVDSQYKYLTKQQNKFRQKADEGNDDDSRKLAEYQEENKDLQQSRDILEKKLKLIEARLLGMASDTAQAKMTKPGTVI